MKASGMKISQKGVDFIKEFEGLKLKAYQDSVGVWTIGYGSTKRVHAGLQITQRQAESRLAEDIASHEGVIQQLVKVDLTQAQYDALASFVFNLGVGAFRSSTLLTELNNGKYGEAAFQLCRWCRAGSDVLPGLLRRRMAEASMFLFG